MSDTDVAGSNDKAAGADKVDRAAEIETSIAELKRRWPAHSVPPQMWDELEDLEDELERLRGRGSEEIDGG